MSITTAVQDITVEPPVSSIAINASPIIQTGTSPVTLYATATNSSGNTVANATLNFLVYELTATGQSLVKTLNATTNSNGTATVSFTPATLIDYSFVVQSASNTSVVSKTGYFYPSSTISASYSSTEIVAGNSVTVKVTVETGGQPFNNTANEAFYAEFGYALVVLSVTDPSGTVSNSSPQPTNSSGQTSFTVTLSSVGTYKIDAVAYGRSSHA